MEVLEQLQTGFGRLAGCVTKPGDEQAHGNSKG